MFNRKITENERLIRRETKPLDPTVSIALLIFLSESRCCSIVVLMLLESHIQEERLEEKQKVFLNDILQQGISAFEGSFVL